MCRQAAFSPVGCSASQIPPPLCDWRSVLCLHTIQVLDSTAYNNRVVRIGLGTSMSPRSCLVTQGSRAVSVCVSPSFSQNPSATRTASGVRLLLISSSNLFATGNAIRRTAVQFSIRHCRVRRSHDQRTSPDAVRLDARLQSLFGTTRQCRAAG